MNLLSLLISVIGFGNLAGDTIGDTNLLLPCIPTLTSRSGSSPSPLSINNSYLNSTRQQRIQNSSVGGKGNSRDSIKRGEVVNETKILARPSWLEKDSVDEHREFREQSEHEKVGIELSADEQELQEQQQQQHQEQQQEEEEQQQQQNTHVTNVTNHNRQGAKRKILKSYLDVTTSTQPINIISRPPTVQHNSTTNTKITTLSDQKSSRQQQQQPYLESQSSISKQQTVHWSEDCSRIIQDSDSNIVSDSDINTEKNRDSVKLIEILSSNRGGQQINSHYLNRPNHNRKSNKMDTSGETSTTDQVYEENKREQFLDSFCPKYEKFIQDFDKLHDEDPFKADQLERMVREFLAKYKEIFLQKIPFASSPSSTFPQCNYQLAYDEDVKLLSLENISSPSESNNGQRAVEVPKEAQICANIYRRAARALYLLQTLKKLRNPKQDIDRYEPFEFARLALRYNSTDSDIALQYSLTLGWYLDTMGTGLEKVRLGALFFNSLNYNIKLNPKSPLAHHLIGRYYFNVSQLSWIERTLASKLFSSNDLAYTVEDAEKSFRLAHSLDAKIAPTGFWMARVLQAQKKPKQEIQEWIEMGLKAKSRQPINDIEREQLEEFKKKGKY